MLNITPNQDLLNATSNSQINNKSPDLILPSTSPQQSYMYLPLTASCDSPKPPVIRLHSSSPNSKSAKSKQHTRSTRTTKKTSSCASCAELSDESGYFSVEESPSLSIQLLYLTTRYPSSTSLYRKIRISCVRSLSCEFCPGREGPVIFGDDENGYTISYVFKIRDFKARGFVRWYSLLFIVSNYISLISCSDLIIRNFKKIVKDIQNKAEAIYEKDQSAPVPQTGTSAAGQYYFPTGLDFRRKISQPGKDLRNLQQLLGEKDLIASFHVSFSVVLKAFSCSFIASGLENKIKKYVDIYKSTNDYIEIDGVETEEEEVGGDEEENNKNKDGAVIEIEKTEDIYLTTFSTYSQVLHALGLKIMSQVIYNTIIGNQIIVRGDEVNLVLSLLLLIKDLIPQYCCSFAGYQKQYKEPYVCNLLGIPSNVEIPDNIDKECYSLVDVKRMEGGIQGGSGKFKKALEHVKYMSWVSFVYEYSGVTMGSTKLLDEIMSVLSYRLSGEIERVRIGIIVQEWITKAKVFKELTKRVSGKHDLKIVNYLKMFDMTEEELPVLCFWRSS